MGNDGARETWKRSPSDDAISFAIRLTSIDRSTFICFIPRRSRDGIVNRRVRILRVASSTSPTFKGDRPFRSSRIDDCINRIFEPSAIPSPLDLSTFHPVPSLSRRVTDTWTRWGRLRPDCCYFSGSIRDHVPLMHRKHPWNWVSSRWSLHFASSLRYVSAWHRPECGSIAFLITYPIGTFLRGFLGS